MNPKEASKYVIEKATEDLDKILDALIIQKLKEINYVMSYHDKRYVKQQILRKLL